MNLCPDAPGLLQVIHLAWPLAWKEIAKFWSFNPVTPLTPMLAFYRHFGAVTDFYLNAERRFAFVEYEKPEEALAAMSGLKEIT